MPRSAGAVLWGLGHLALHGLLPFELSRRPNRVAGAGLDRVAERVAGLLAVAGGGGLIAWAIATHLASAPRGWALPPKPEYLLRGGPYHLSRNPMYVGGAAVWFGWALFYASPAVWAGLTVFCASTAIAVRWEERWLMEQFGDAYRAYLAEVPRWLGWSPPPAAGLGRPSS